MKLFPSLLIKRLACAALFFGLLNCGDLRYSPNDSTGPFVAGTPVPEAISTLEAEAIIEFINSPFATAYRLKSELFLRASVADSIIEERYGKDGAYDTVDDEPIDTLAELRMIEQVDEESVFRLRDYVLSYGWVAHNHSPALGSPLPDLTVTEGEQILDFVNTASEELMNRTVGLSSQSVASILQSRPIYSIAELASLDFVGERLFLLLRDYTAQVSCAVESTCGDGYQCTGQAIKGRDYRGRCRPSVSLTTEVESCSADQLCGAEMVCAGLSTASEGQCVPSWMQDQFSLNEFIPIPDGEVEGIAAGLSVFGLGKRVLDISVRLEIYHSNPSELRVDLISPDGDRRILAKDLIAEGIETQNGVFELDAEDFAGISSANGDWTIVLSDRNTQEMGALVSWQLEISSAN